MKVLKPIDSRFFVSIDIETVRLAENFGDLPEPYQDAWAYKNKQDGEIPTHEELTDLWVRTSSLYPEFSKICAISLAFLDESGTTLCCKGMAGTDEGALLTDAFHFLNRISQGNPKFRLIGHAAKYFDYPFMCKRYVINRIEIPKILDDTDKKPWETLNTCTNMLWKMGGTGPGSSLQALCVALEVPVSKTDMVGDEVGREYFAGNITGIRDYCNQDAVATFNVLRRYKYEEIFQFDEVVYMNDDEAVEVEEAAPMPPMEMLFRTKDFKGVEDQIKEAILSKKVTKKDWTMLEKMVTDCYIENAMFKADPKKVAEAKTQEVAEFFVELKKEYDAKK